MATLDSLEIVVKGNTADAEKKLQALEDRIKGLSKAGGGSTVSPPVVKTMKAVENSAKKANSVLGNLGKSIGRIAFYRAIRTVVKEITQGFSEGIKNAYAWAEANNHAFQSVMDEYATEGLYIKNTLGAVASTILTALLPTIVAIGDAFVTVINYVNEFIAALTGQDTYLRAVKTATRFGEETDKAAAAQKKLNQQLMAFDELNVIHSPRDNGSGAADNTVGGFEETRVSTFYQNVLGIIDRAKTKVSQIVTDLVNGFKEGFSYLNIDTLKHDFETIVDYAKKIAEKFDTPTWKQIGEMAGKLLALVAQLTAFGTSSAFQHLYNLVTLIDSILHLNPFTAILSVFRELLTVVNDFAGIFTRVIDFFSGGNLSTWLDNAFQRGIQSIDDWIDGSNRTITPAEIDVPMPYNYYRDNAAHWRAYQGLDDEFASGGYPSQGSIFAAGEVPGQYELLGTINGRTGVAGGAEITGISDAVYATGGETNALLRELISVSKGGIGRPNAAFGKYVTESLRLYKGVTG